MTKGWDGILIRDPSKSANELSFISISLFAVLVVVVAVAVADVVDTTLNEEERSEERKEMDGMGEGG